MTADIPGYGFGSPEAAQSPLSTEDLLHVEQAVGWTSEDEHRLRRHAELFRAQADQMVAFVPVTTDIRHFLEGAIADPTELTAVERAWTKAVHLHVALWSRPYTREGLW